MACRLLCRRQKILVCSENKLLLREEVGAPGPTRHTHFLTGSSPCFISSRMAVGAV